MALITTFLIYERELNYENTLCIKLRIKSCHRHCIRLKPRERNKECLILHNRITNNRRPYLTIKIKGTPFSLFFLGTGLSETLKKVQKDSLELSFIMAS